MITKAEIKESRDIHESINKTMNEIMMLLGQLPTKKIKHMTFRQQIKKFLYKSRQYKVEGFELGHYDFVWKIKWRGWNAGFLAQAYKKFKFTSEDLVMIDELIRHERNPFKLFKSMKTASKYHEWLHLDTSIDKLYKYITSLDKTTVVKESESKVYDR